MFILHFRPGEQHCICLLLQLTQGYINRKFTTVAVSKPFLTTAAIVVNITIGTEKPLQTKHADRAATVLLKHRQTATILPHTRTYAFDHHNDRAGR